MVRLEFSTASLTRAGNPSELPALASRKPPCARSIYPRRRARLSFSEPAGKCRGIIEGFSAAILARFRARGAYTRGAPNGTHARPRREWLRRDWGDSAGACSRGRQTTAPAPAVNPLPMADRFCAPNRPPGAAYLGLKAVRSIWTAQETPDERSRLRAGNRPLWRSSAPCPDGSVF
jgi:hypothetical protein